MKHPRVKNTRQSQDVEGRTIFVIETDLPISPNDPHFSAEAFRELEKAAQSYLHDNSIYDDFRIRPLRS
jgi:hypothetical protein